MTEMLQSEIYKIEHILGFDLSADTMKAPLDDAQVHSSICHEFNKSAKNCLAILQSLLQL